jgi:outer membrane protein assembly factor BamA
MSRPEHDQPAGPDITLAELVFENVFQLTGSEQEQIAASLKQRTYTGAVDEVTNEVLERTRVAWQGRGYFKVQATADSKVLTSSPANQRIAVTIHLDEAKQYRLRSITFVNNRAVSNVQALRDLFPINDGDVFDRDEVGKGLASLTEAYGEMGYINFTSAPNTRFDDENSVVDLEISVDEGKQFYISGITILGRNERLLQDALKDLPLQPADIYNERLVNWFLVKYASSMNKANDRNIPLLQRDEQAGTVAITFDLRHCEGR